MVNDTNDCESSKHIRISRIKRSEDRPDLLTLHATISLSSHNPFTLRGTKTAKRLCYFTTLVKCNAHPVSIVMSVIYVGSHYRQADYRT